MWRFGLRGRMAASYVLVTTTTVLLVEAVIVAFYLLPQAAGSSLAANLQELAARESKVLGLGVSELSFAHPEFPPRKLLSGAAQQSKEEIMGGTGQKNDYATEVLIDRDGLIVDTTTPDLYPQGGTLKIPGGGEESGGKAMTKDGPVTWYFSPIYRGNGKTLEVIGYVYVQAPPDALERVPSSVSLLPLLAPGLVVAGLTVPVGLVFGLLSTRRLRSRVRRLATVTTTVAAGDFRPRVEVSGADEVSTLEHSFNVMTDQLGAAVESARDVARTEARQSERGRIARELHDSISQDLFSLSLLAAGMRRAAPAELRGQAESMERTAARAMREMQALLLELRPVALEDAGLLPALEELCHAYQTRLGVRVETKLEDVTLSPPAEHAVLRLVQEALGNAIKHADPARIEVRLSQDDGVVTVAVSDDGQGFDPASVATRHGMGLTLMRERVAELGGECEIHSDGSGTTVRASLP